MRWFWLGTADTSDRVFTRGAVTESLAMDIPGLVEVVQDDQRGAYSFSANLWLVSHGGMLRGDRKALTIEHPQAGKTNAELARSDDPLPNAVTLGLRQCYPSASTEPRARLRVMEHGTTFQLRPELGSDAPVALSSRLAGFVDPWLTDLPEEDDPIDPSATPEAEAYRRADALDAEGAAQIERQEWDLAEATLRRAIEESPWHHVAWERLVGIALRRERSAEAFARLRELVDTRDELPAKWHAQLGTTIHNRLAWVARGMAHRGELDLLRELIAWSHEHDLTWPDRGYYERALAGKLVDAIDPPPPWERAPAASPPSAKPASTRRLDPPRPPPPPRAPAKRPFPQHIVVGLALLVMIAAWLLLGHR